MIWTFGYRGQRVEDLRWLIEQTGAIILDIRLNPRSERPEWNEHALRGSLLPNYRSMRELGNVNYANGGPIAIADLEAGLSAISEYAPVDGSDPFWNDLVLMCGCRDRETCHRDVVAKAVEKRFGVETHELRFTWCKDAPLACPVCRLAKFRSSTRTSVQPDIMYGVEGCGHHFVWRPAER